MWGIFFVFICATFRTDRFFVRPRHKKNPHYGDLIWWGCSDCIIPVQNQANHNHLIILGDFVGPLSLRCASFRTDRFFVRPRHKKNPHYGDLIWWPWSDSNRHSLQNLILSQARLPIPPRGQMHCDKLCSLFCINFFDQTCTAIRLVCWLFSRCSRFASLLFNGFFNCSHVFCQT